MSRTFKNGGDVLMDVNFKDSEIRYLGQSEVPSNSPENRIKTSLNCLEEELVQLGSNVSNLSIKLSPVLEMRPTDEDSQEPYATSDNLNDRIRRCLSAVRLINHAILSASDRLEI